MSRRNWVFDVAVAAVVGLLGQLEAWWGIGATHRQGPLWAQSLLYAVTALLLVVRRVRPLTVLVAVVAVSAAEFALFGSPEGDGVALASLVAIYSVGRYVEARRAVLGLVLGVALWVSWAGFDPLNDDLAERFDAVVWLAPWVIAWLVGALVRMTLLYREQRRVTRAQAASRAVAEERNRIARELHDVIGHSVSVMTVQASAVRRRLTDEQVAEREALETVEAVGREALAEMRRMVGVLRHGEDTSADQEREPVPGLDQLDRLVGKFRSAGLPVELLVTGEARSLAPGLDLTAYRLVQEGLTNTFRHAQNPHRAEVMIDYGLDRLQLAVRDDGQPSRPAQAQHREAGNGLLGLRERVAIYGGSLVAQTRPEGGFELVAMLPLEPT
ncbi:sensor histidine kinase [Kribbella pittospori]|uniref:histidine kinase n=1 Tax=Kribbella pittospori TaxID=722689 RepID=A0A4R0K6G1_9ACTN|nr:histidine kinase [Kribbella pittospori]TCC54424.1 sensor histidine kinase [Kribbella pittospori]